MTYIAGIEARGTKFIVSLGTTTGRIIAQQEIATTTPQEVMPQVIQCLERFYQQQAFTAIGIGCFGPIDPSPTSVTYGHITTTPKQAWQHYDIVGAIKQAFPLPIGFDTDVNGAALGEYYWGQAQGLNCVVYVTVGTGVGIGVVINGQPLHGAMHPEGGHLLIPQRPEDDFAGVCPFHGNCLEGLVSGPALLQRVGVKKATDITADHPVWALQAQYLSYAAMNYILTLAPQRIIWGGGVMQQPGLLAQVRDNTVKALAGYIDNDMTKNMEKSMVYACLGQQTGVLGSLAIAVNIL